MIKLKSGETLGQYTKADKAPYIHNFVQPSTFVKPQTQKTSTSVISFGK